MNELKSKLPAAGGILTLLITLLLGNAGPGVLLLCCCLITAAELLFRFRENILRNPYTLMLFSPLLLMNFSTIGDFNIRLFSFLLIIYIGTVAYRGLKPAGQRISFGLDLAVASPLKVWALAFLIFTAASCLLYVQGIHLSGDEPHYLMITQSLTDDFDFDLKNNFEEKSYFLFLPIELRFHGGEYNGKYLSFHLPGVSFLLLPFFLLFKLLNGLVPPALFFRLAASIINAFFALCLFYVLKLHFPEKSIAGFWLFCLLVFPLVFHGVHLYPELPGATLLMAAYLFAFGPKRRYFLSGLFLAMVPWFHIKYVPPLLVLTAAILFRSEVVQNRLPSGLKNKRVPPDRNGTLRDVLVFFIIPFFSFMVLVIYSKVLYGSFSPADIFPKESYWSVPWLLRIKVFLAYFLDQRDGLLFYSPVFFLFFFSLRRKFADKGILLGMGFSYVFFHAFTTVRGAYSPAGRPLMLVSWIMILFIAGFYLDCAQTDQSGASRRFVFRFLGGLCVFTTTWFFYYPLFVYQPVFAGTVERASDLNLFLGGNFIEIWNLFPSFLTSPQSGHRANVVWLGLIAAALLFFYLRPIVRIDGLSAKSKMSPEYRRGISLFLTAGLVFLYCLYPHINLSARNKHIDKVISFYNNSKNFRYLPEREGFRIKAGNTYDIYIDRAMVRSSEVTLHFKHTDKSGVVLRNGKRVLFRSSGDAESSFTLPLAGLNKLNVKNKSVSHIGFETSTSEKDAFLWLVIK